MAAYYGFVLAALALAVWLDARRAFQYKNKPSELALAGETHRWVVYYLLGGLFAGAATFCKAAGLATPGFGMYAGF